MAQPKYNTPMGPPPGYENAPSQPAPAHYGNGYQDPQAGAMGTYMGQPAPPNVYGPPAQYGQYGPPQGGYYNQGPMMYQQGPYGPPQGGYYGGRSQGGGAAEGICAGLLGAMACCCCLDFCIF